MLLSGGMVWLARLGDPRADFRAVSAARRLGSAAASPAHSRTPTTIRRSSTLERLLERGRDAARSRDHPRARGQPARDRSGHRTVCRTPGDRSGERLPEHAPRQRSASGNWRCSGGPALATTGSQEQTEMILRARPRSHGLRRRAQAAPRTPRAPRTDETVAVSARRAVPLWRACRRSHGPRLGQGRGPRAGTAQRTINVRMTRDVVTVRANRAHRRRWIDEIERAALDAGVDRGHLHVITVGGLAERGLRRDGPRRHRHQGRQRHGHGRVDRRRGHRRGRARADRRRARSTKRSGSRRISGDISAETTNGAITHAAIAVGTVEAHTVNGNITLRRHDCRPRPATASRRTTATSWCRCRTRRMCRSIVRATRGDFRSGLTGQGPPAAPRCRGGRRASYTLGNGSAEMDSRAFGGEIRSRRRRQPCGRRRAAGDQRRKQPKPPAASAQQCSDCGHLQSLPGRADFAKRRVFRPPDPSRALRRGITTWLLRRRPMCTTCAAQPRILIADDQPDLLDALKLLLKGQGIETDAVTSPEAVLRALEAGRSISC